MKLNASPPSATPDVVYSPPPDAGLDIVFMDAHLIVVHKPSGLLTVPGRGEGRGDCLISRAQRQVADAMIVHRLDMATSGLLVLARSTAMQSRLSQLFQHREVNKRYVAIVHGLLASDEGLIDLPLITDWPRRPMQKVCHEQGKSSQTQFAVITRVDHLNQTRVELEPITGRSHQLRVHMLALGHAIVGDPLYGDQAVQNRYPRLMLHASQLRLPHPMTGELLMWHRPPDF